MQQIDDLKNIFSAMQEIGAAWQGEVVKLREENSRLANKNAELQKNFDALKNDINNLSEKAGQLAKNIRDEIIKELDVVNREKFQRLVEDKFAEVLAKFNKPAEENKTADTTPAIQYNTGNVENYD